MGAGVDWFCCKVKKLLEIYKTLSGVHPSQFEYQMENVYKDFEDCRCMVLLVVAVAHVPTASLSTSIAASFPRLVSILLWS